MKNLLSGISLLTCLAVAMPAAAQGRKPSRSAAPQFKAGQFEGIFFPDPSSQLKGTLPTQAVRPWRLQPPRRALRLVTRLPRHSALRMRTGTIWHGTS